MRCKRCGEELWFGRARNGGLPDTYRDNQDYKSCHGSMVVMHQVELSEIELMELAVIALS